VARSAGVVNQKRRFVMKRVIFAGASLRSLGMFVEPVVQEYKEMFTAAGIYDLNPVRARYIGNKFDIPIYTDFNEMLCKSNADLVIVTTVDAYHHEYIIKSLEAGLDVITEKPMTIDAEKTRAILEAEKKSGKKVTVTFNYRYAPYPTKIKELISSGVIGDIYSVHFEWILDCNMDIYAHGTSYFRRWNRYMDKSGGLLVHKSTHHFDIINWFLDDVPEQVSAFGELRRYGKNGNIRGSNCRNCVYSKECEFYYDISKNEFEMDFYVAAEGEDGYYKDGCVFAEDIDIYDTMSVNVRYKKGAMMSYSLTAHSPYEGWRLAVNGSKGRLEAFLPETGQLTSDIHTIRIFEPTNNIITYDMPNISHGHGGGDVRLIRDLFIGDREDTLGHKAGSQDGVNSIMIGIAANLSIKENRIVTIADLLI